MIEVDGKNTARVFIFVKENIAMGTGRSITH